MKILFFTILVISSTQRSNAGVVRKPPAFATPVYSNSYLPAAMQVIFHAVDQLKHLEAEETVSTSPATTIALPTTSPHAPGQHQPSAEEVSIQSTVSTASEASTASIAYMASTASELSTDFTVSEVSSDSSVSEVTVASVSESSIDSVASDASSDSAASDASLASSTDSDAPAVSDASTASSIVSETSAASTASEVVTGSAVSEISATSTVSEDSTASIAAINPTGSTPTFKDIIDDSQSPAPQNADVINEEKPEVIEEVTVAGESKAETPEENYATPEINHEVQEIGQEESESNQEIPEKNESDDQSPIPSLSTSSEVVEVSATTALPKPEDHKDSSEEDEGEENSSEESKEKSGESEGKGSSESKSDEDDSSEEEDDEIRFTLIGEKVSQVPRPSLSNYLRKTARAPLRGSVQDLATLYDALSKDARKQGLGKYAGYSDEVLQTLESSIEGGVGPQLRILLEKAQERNELTRDDAKKKLSVALKKLSDPASILSRDLRRLIPLRYIP